MIDTQTFEDIFGKDFDFEILMQAWEKLPKPTAQQYSRIRRIQIPILRRMDITNINDFIGDPSVAVEIETMEFELMYGGGNTFYWKPTGKIYII